MTIDPNNPNDVLDLMNLLDRARKNGKKLKVNYERATHTSQQRKYLHFALSYFAHLYGCTLVEAKEVHLKRYCCPELFDSGLRDKGGKVVLRSTSELTDAEYSSAIANFREYAELNECPIPDPSDTASIRYCEKQIDKTQMYGTR